MDFAALHIRTGYSFLQSGITLKNAFNAAIKNNYYAFGLTDVNTLTGYPELDKISAASKIKPIYGCDIKFEEDTLSFFVLNEEGYKNLIKISYFSSQNELNGYLLKKHSNGLALVLDVGSCKLSSFTKEKEVVDYLTFFNRTFDIFYLGIPYGNQHQNIIKRVKSFVTKYPYPLIAFPHMLYEKEDDEIILEIVNAIRQKIILNNKKSKGPNYFLSLDTIASYYNEEEIKNTVELANKCNFKFNVKRGSLMKFPVPEGTTADEFLHKTAFDGLKKKKPDYTKEYEDRLNYELSMIKQMGYSDYFLIVQDYINFARSNGIYVGPGRGSGAGSLVSYALNIVKEDPIKYGLLFERFLNPYRQSLPDLDVDFADYRRDEVGRYVISKYGQNRSAYIVTMQSLGAKGAIRDVGSVFDIPDREIDMLSNAVADSKKTLRENYKLGGTLKQLVDSEPQYLEIVALASKLESLPRQSGVHPAGIVLNNEDLLSSIPVKKDPEHGMIVQFEHDYLEDQGFLKMDILALRNLSIIERCIKLIKLNKDIDLDYMIIPYDDPKAIETIRQGNVMGLFQLESEGMKRANKILNPTCFEDIVALISLFRPGPMDEIQTYGRRKQGKEPITYPTPLVESILKPTYGVIIYQEQVMSIVQVLAGFSLAEADLFRRAISKKDSSKILASKGQFLDGCKKNNVPDIVANKVFDLILKFCGYAFNKSHSLSYSIITCQMAYLKVYYPDEFYSSILDYSANIGDSTFMKIVAELKKFHYSLVTPNVNESSVGFVIKDKKVILPLLAIKEVKTEFAVNLLNERIESGPFKDFYDFVLRAKKYGLTQPILVSIIDSGALDSLENRRNALRQSSSDAINYAEMIYGPDGKQLLLDFELPKPPLKNVEENFEENLTAEKESIGMMLSSSPLLPYRSLTKYKNLKTIADLDDVDYSTKVLCIVGNSRVRTTKKNTSMVTVTLYDEDSSRSFVGFQKMYDESYSLIKKDKIALATVRKDFNREDSFIVEKLEAVTKE